MAKRSMKISEKTIRCRLGNDFGLNRYRPAQKPGLTEAIKKKRFKFAKNILTGIQRCGITFGFQIYPQ